jgi:hypothetical protein
MWLDANLVACYTCLSDVGSNSPQEREVDMSGNIITALRQNHALEHATIAFLIKKLGVNIRMIGFTTHDGFYIYGDAPTEAVRDAATEGLEHLQKGERELAVSPFCGTNLVVAGIMAGIASLIVMGSKDRRKRLFPVILATTWAIVAARPVGRAVQKYVTTSSNLTGVSIKRITRRGVGTRMLHKIETTRE